MIRNNAAYWAAVNRAAPAIRWTLADRGGACEYWRRASRFYRESLARGDKQDAAAHLKDVREYENILAAMDAAEGGGI